MCRISLTCRPAIDHETASSDWIGLARVKLWNMPEREVSTFSGSFAVAP